MSTEKPTSEEMYKEVENEFHKSNELWQKIASAYADSSLKLFDDTIKFVYQALTAMGIISGFGFAGIQGVENFIFFFMGELTMFLSMMFGFYRIKVIYVKNSDSIEEASVKVREAYQNKAIALANMMKDIQATGKISDKSNIDKFEESNNEIYKLFGIDEKPKKKKDESWFITVMICFFILGFILLLLSFIPKKYFQAKIPDNSANKIEDIDFKSLRSDKLNDLNKYPLYPSHNQTELYR